MTFRKRIRTNRWHVVYIGVESNNTGYGIEKEIRINSDPSQRSTAAYLTPKKARELAAALVKAAKIVETDEKKRKAKDRAIGRSEGK